jgi:2-aminoadipate transaminase
MTAPRTDEPVVETRSIRRDLPTGSTRWEPDRSDLSHLVNDGVRAATSSVIRDLLRLVDRPGMLSLAGGLPTPELLPVDRVGAAVAARLAADGPRALQYAPTEGVPELRALVAADHANRIGHTDHGDRPAQVDDVIVTTGSQQGLDLLARALLGPGATVVVEAPGYLGAIQAFRLSGATMVAVPGDADGLRTEVLADRLAAGMRPALVYVVPNFGNPSGATLGLARRRHLAELADRYRFVVVEDDPYGALRFRGDALPRLATMTANAVTLGTASKVVAPGLRVGWLVAPAWLTPAVVRLKQVADLHTSTLDQLVVADLLADAPFMAGQLDRLRASYRPRADALVDAVRTMPGAPLTVAEPAGGMFCWATLRAPRATHDLLPAALDAGVAFVPGSAFHLDDSGDSSMRLCFTTLSVEQIGEAIDRLATVL